jgi:hypothetical protein
MIEPYICIDGNNLDPKPDAISESDAEKAIAKICAKSYLYDITQWDAPEFLFCDGVYKINKNWGYDVKSLLDKYEVALKKPFESSASAFYAPDAIALERFLIDNYTFKISLLEKRKPTAIEPYLPEGSDAKSPKPDPIPVQEIEERVADVFSRLPRNELDWSDKVILISRGQYRTEQGWIYDFKPFLKKYRVTAPGVLCSASGNYYAPNEEALYKYLGVIVAFKVAEVVDENSSKR